MRPRRKRKRIDYGEGHLHWIEESQLHKALMKSLREKSGKNAPESDEGDCPSTSSSKAPSESTTSKCDNRNSAASDTGEMKFTVPKVALPETRPSRNDESSDSGKSPKLRPKRNFSSSSSDTTSSHATMMQPRNSDSSSSDLQTSEKSSGKEGELSDSIPPHLKTIAQRKFPSNSTQNTRHGFRIEKKLKKCGRANADDKCEPISDRPLPRTKDFINYVCFRNTPFHFELEDGT